MRTFRQAKQKIGCVSEPMRGRMRARVRQDRLGSGSGISISFGLSRRRVAKYGCVEPHAASNPALHERGGRKGANEQRREPDGSMRQTIEADVRMRTRRDDGVSIEEVRRKYCGSYCDAHRLPAGMTAAKEESARGVVPVRQKNCSKIDYCNCPRHMPHLWKRLNFSYSLSAESTHISE
jgi:hypothetical protein